MEGRDDDGDASAHEAALRDVCVRLRSRADLDRNSLQQLADSYARRLAALEMRTQHVQKLRLHPASATAVLARNYLRWSELLQQYDTINDVLEHTPCGAALQSPSIRRADRVLRNVESVLFLIDFYRRAPAEMAVLRTDIATSHDAQLFNVFERVIAFERMRRLALLDATDLPRDTQYFQERVFAGVARARADIEMRVWRTLRNVRVVAVEQPRIVVAAMRIVEGQEEEDRWWGAYTASIGRQSDAALIAPLLYYERRCLAELRAGIAQRIDRAFAAVPGNSAAAAMVGFTSSAGSSSATLSGAVDRSAGVLFAGVNGNSSSGENGAGTSPPPPAAANANANTSAADSPPANGGGGVGGAASDAGGARLASPASGGGGGGLDELVDTTLRVAMRLMEDHYVVSKHVRPCFPERYMPHRLFVREYNQRLLERISALLKISPALSDESYLSIIKWYVEYRLRMREGGALDEDLQVTLSARDRTLLAPHYRRYFRQVMQLMVDQLIVRNSHSRAGVLVSLRQLRGAKFTTGPEHLFSLVSYQVQEASLVLNTEDLVEHVGTVADVLSTYAQRMCRVLRARGEDALSLEFTGAVSNDASQCAENLEELKKLLGSLLDEAQHLCLERFDRVAEEFHAMEVRAKQAILSIMFNDIASEMCNLFSPRRGTQLMLDIVDKLRELMHELKSTLIELHFREVTLCCLARMVNEYFAAFTSADKWHELDGIAVLNLITNDVDHLGSFFAHFVKGRSCEAIVAPIRALRKLFTCLPSIGVVRSAYIELDALWSTCSPEIVDRALGTRPEVDAETRQQCVRACSAVAKASAAAATQQRQQAVAHMPYAANGVVEGGATATPPESLSAATSLTTTSARLTWRPPEVPAAGAHS